MTWQAVDTWGISGSTFLPAYLLTSLVALAGSVLWWRWAVTRPLGRIDGHLEPIEVAFVSGGPRRALQAVLAALRVAEAIGLGRRRRLFPRQAPGIDDAGRNDTGRNDTGGNDAGSGSAALCRAAYAALARGRIGRRLHREPEVVAALERLQTGLQHAGWLRTGREVWQVRLTTTSPLWAMVALGAARIVAGLANHKSVWGVVFVSIGTAAMATVLASGTPAQTGPAVRRLSELRQRHRRLTPGDGHRGAGNGDDTVLGVALFGSAALWAFDPGLAAAAQVPFEPYNATDQLWDATGRGDSGYWGDSGTGCDPGGG